MRIVLCALISILSIHALAQDIKHKFVATDESGHQLIYVDQRKPSTNWAIELKARDIQLVGNDRVSTAA